VVRLAGKMLRDPHVRQSIEYIAGPLCAANWKFKPASNAPIDREVADACTWAFFEQLPWKQILRRTVQRYAAYGFSLIEITDDNRPVPTDRFPLHPGKGFALVPTGFHEVPASTIYRWHQSKLNGAQIEGITQHVVGSDGEAAGFRRIEADRLLRLTYDQEGGNFAGFSVLRSAYQPWKLKMAFVTLDAIKHDRTAVPFPVVEGSEDATDEDLDAAETILQEMRSHERGYLALPSGWKFRWEGAGGSDAGNIRIAIEACNTDFAVNVSAGFTRLGLTGSGSYALGNTQQGVYHLAVKGHADFVSTGLYVGADGFSPVERFVRANYGDKVQVPQVIVKNLPTRPALEIAKVYINGVTSGAFTADDPTEDEIRESLELGPRDPTTARKKAPAPMTAPTDPDDEPADEDVDEDVEEEREAA
jgi:hypothetical protein